jgi:hypothetical protein
MKGDRPEFEESPQDPVEVVNYLAYLRKNLRKRFDNVCDLETTFVEQYSIGAANIHAHLSSRCSERGICLQVGIAMRETSQADVNELAVFVPIGESVQEGEAFQTKSLVRLVALDDCDVFVRDMFKASPPSSGF